MDEWTGKKHYLLYMSILSMKTCPFVSMMSIPSILVPVLVHSTKILQFY